MTAIANGRIDSELIVGFARRVERLCERLINEMDPGDDRNAIEDLRTEAENISQYTNAKSLAGILSGIAEVL